MGKKNKRTRPEKLSRAKILKKYGLSLGTLEILNGIGIFENEFEYRRGKSFLPITKRDDFVLRCARNEITSFGGKNVFSLPFHRFLILRMINTPADEIYDEIFQIGLLPSMNHFPMKEFQAIFDSFIENSPEELRKMFEKSKDPRGKKERNFLEVFLKVMNLEIYYDEPRLVEELLFFTKMKERLEAMMTTKAKSGEIAEAISKSVGLEVPIEAVVSYRMLFYSTHDILERDFEKYLLLVTPEERGNKSEANGLTLTEFCVRRGVDQAVQTKQVLEVIFLQAQKEVLYLSRFKNADSAQAARAAFDRLLKAHEALEAIGAASGTSRENVAKLFDKFIVREVDEQEDGPVLTIHDINKKGVGKVESGSE
jgi:hypothetical protein